MKTLEKQIEINFNSPFGGHPSREPEHDIEQIKLAVLRLLKLLITLMSTVNLNPTQT